jgi:hypothetical protein
MPSDRQMLYLTTYAQIPGENNLSVLKRKPSDLRRYMEWTIKIKAQYGSMTNYLMVFRLPKAWGSPPFTPASSVPFADPSDYRVLTNDWPYGLTPDITHLVVWLRTPSILTRKLARVAKLSQTSSKGYSQISSVQKETPRSYGSRIGSRCKAFHLSSTSTL